ncbi:hypothetical protein AVEN_17867-1 [Araneus ventricosus]|uniref:Reverse transcriptase domain-containing protein n=1 Tax=Araneus ventricosus TaxID=182803 RepID=A0A4Y2LT23_ARAVE|nr:hypothetical protein AVEN_17867-1 [Araneus ventricosus]
MGGRKFCSAASHPYGKQYKAAFRKSVFPSQIPYLMNGDPKGSLQQAAQNILDKIFHSPAIPTNYNITTSTQPPDPPISPPRNLGERRKRPAAGLLLSSYYTPTDNREGAGETYDSEADLSSGVHQQPERPTAWLQRRQVCGYSHQRATKQIQTARRDGKHVLVLSIDIKGAFDNLQHRAILWTPAPAQLTKIDSFTAFFKIGK